MGQMISSVLKDAQTIDPRDAELLLTHVLNISRESLIAHPDWRVGILDRLRFLSLANKRNRGIPLAYLTGKKWFFGLDFFVNKHTLIPRPETELLVDAVVDCLNTLGGRDRTIYIDIGTGSGCIPIAVTTHMNAVAQYNEITTLGIVQIYATDISRNALAVAKKNAKRHKTQINFLRGDLLDPVFQHCFSCMDPTAAVISANLPYLTETQYQHSPTPEIHFEPISALVAEDNGLAIYKKLICQIQQYFFSEGGTPKKILCFFEIDPSQSKALAHYAQTIFPNAIIDTHKDFSGYDRVFRMRLDG